MSDLDAVVLGGFLHDIGKFMQRAHPGSEALAAVRSRETDVLPSREGRSTHWHALWTDAFFQACESEGLGFPGGVNFGAVRDVAVYHHKPAKPLHLLAVEGDRLAAGMDRKAHDEAAEADASQGRDAFRRTALRSIFANVDLGVGSVPAASMAYRVDELSPGALVPGPVAGEAQKQAYAKLWPSFFQEFTTLCRQTPNLELFHEGLLSLSERFLWAVPSSTIDQPDVPLHDHSKAAAAVAACLYRFHHQRDELGDEGAIKARDVPKFRLLAGDVSGIQNALFRLAAQGVKGNTRILRARSFMIAAVVEAAALACRRALALPPHCELLAAGGRFLLLVPALAEVEDVVARVQRDLDRWLARRYFGDLALNLALGPPLTREDLMRERLPAALEAVGQAVAEAKLRPLSNVETGVLPAEYAEGADGACSACGVRPATRQDRLDNAQRCQACHDEHTLGGLLPRAQAVLWTEGATPARLRAGGACVIEMPAGLHLVVVDDVPRQDDAEVWRRVVSGWRLPGTEAVLPAAVRHLANHVPRLTEDDVEALRYRDLDRDSASVRPGEAKTFAHLAADALEPDGEGGLKGRPMLAVLKADVDRLGRIFSHGLGADMGLARLATLSRLMDAFFTIVLPDRLRREEFRNTYTVYAGGDDLLLLGPWQAMLRLADEIGRAFRAHVGANPNVTLSAGIELFHPHEPLHRAVGRAEGRLEAAKEGGRNRVSLIARDTLACVAWDDLEPILADAERIVAWLRDGQRPVSRAFVYRTLAFARQRDRAEALKPGEEAEVGIATWRARWAYALRRSFKRNEAEDERRLQFFDRLLGSGLTIEPTVGPPAEVPLVIALYRNR